MFATETNTFPSIFIFYKIFCRWVASIKTAIQQTIEIFFLMMSLMWFCSTKGPLMGLTYPQKGLQVKGTSCGWWNQPPIHLVFKGFNSKFNLIKPDLTETSQNFQVQVGMGFLIGPKLIEMILTFLLFMDMFTKLEMSQQQDPTWRITSKPLALRINIW